jgi:uncharacterized protein (TIGR03083 family)
MGVGHGERNAASPEGAPNEGDGPVEPSDLLAANQEALRRACSRLAEATGLAADLEVPIHNSRWTARDTVAHLVSVCALYTDLVGGAPSSYPDMTPETCAAEGDKRIADIPERDPAKLAALLEDAAERFLTTTARHAAEQEIVHCGVRLDLAGLAGWLLGEVLLHGYDVTSTLRRPWPLDPADAALVLTAYAPGFGVTVDPERSRGLTAAFGIDLGSAGRFVVRFADGRYSLGPWDPDGLDCTITADPVAFLLVASGRLDRFAAFALNVMAAAGARPELALEFNDLFRYP